MQLILLVSRYVECFPLNVVPHALLLSMPKTFNACTIHCVNKHLLVKNKNKSVIRTIFYSGSWHSIQLQEAYCMKCLSTILLVLLTKIKRATFRLVPKKMFSFGFPSCFFSWAQENAIHPISSKKSLKNRQDMILWSWAEKKSPFSSRQTTIRGGHVRVPSENPKTVFESA